MAAKKRDRDYFSQNYSQSSRRALYSPETFKCKGASIPRGILPDIWLLRRFQKETRRYLTQTPRKEVNLSFNKIHEYLEYLLNGIVSCQSFVNLSQTIANINRKIGPPLYSSATRV